MFVFVFVLVLVEKISKFGVNMRKWQLGGRGRLWFLRMPVFIGGFGSLLSTVFLLQTKTLPLIVIRQNKTLFK